MVSHTNTRGARLEEIIFYALLVVCGSIPVAGTLRADGTFGAEATIGLVLLLLGLLGLAIAAGRAIRHES